MKFNMWKDFAEQFKNWEINLLCFEAENYVKEGNEAITVEFFIMEGGKQGIRIYDSEEKFIEAGSFISAEPINISVKMWMEQGEIYIE